MADLIVLAIVVGIYLWDKISLETKVDNYPISKVSVTKLGMDAGKSPDYIKRQMVQGKYDKDDKNRI